MGTTPLRQFLQSLCCNSWWNYAVFWKLQHHDQMLMTWEDEYSDIPTPWKSMEGILGDVQLQGPENASSSNCEPCVHDENSVKLVVSGKSSIQYPLGQGLVGEVACTGKYIWIFHDDIVAGEFSSKLVPGYPDELLLQFVAGIQTVLLVPVTPYGVLQLGSLETVSENLDTVADIKNKFYINQHLVGYSLPLTSGTGNLAWSSSLMSYPAEMLDDFPFITLNETGVEDLKVGGDVKITSNEVSSATQMTPLPMVEFPSQISGKDVLNFLPLETENNTSSQSVGSVELLEHVNCSINCNNLGMKSNMFKFSCPEEELMAFSYCNNNAISAYGEYANKVNLSSDGIMTEQTYAIMGSNHTGQENLSTSLIFPYDSELQNALAPSLIGQIDGYLWNSSITGEQACDNLSFVCHENLFCGSNMSVWDSTEWFSEVEGAALLLEDEFVNSSDNLNCNISDQLSCEKLSLSPSEKLAATFKEKGLFEDSALVKEDTVSWSCLTSDTAAMGVATAKPSRSASSLESVISAGVGEQHKKGHDFLHVKKGLKPSSISKRRQRPSTTQKPRPRDRQLIQDRLKELRELVPNGSKYSIDSLLDQTIKHMLFLRSVTDRADKLKQWVHQKDGDSGDRTSSKTKPDCRSGASWAVELGSQKQIWPMVVKDLECPGHMKIEMMCDDDRRFLEIADVILRLELTILTGVMKRCSEDMWAVFVVEAPEGFRRMDIFWPLMQLLQQNRHPVSSKI